MSKNKVNLLKYFHDLGNLAFKNIGVLAAEIDLEAPDFQKVRYFFQGNVVEFRGQAQVHSLANKMSDLSDFLLDMPILSP